MKKIFAIAAAGALAALPSLASASVFGCNGCTPQQMADLAWSELYSPGVQPGYIVNLANGTVAKYTNIANIPDPFDPEPPPYEPNVIPVPVEPEVASLIYDLYVLTSGNTFAVDAPAAAASNAVALKSSSSQTSGDRLPVNVFESLMNAPLEQQVAETVRRDAQDIAYRIAQFTALSMEYRRFFDDTRIPMEVTFRFRDGSSSKYHYVSYYNQWIYIDGSAVDARGNVIPEQKEDVFNGDFFEFGAGTGPAEDLDWFRWLVESFGVPVIDMRSHFTGGGFVCVDNVCYIQNT